MRASTLLTLLLSPERNRPLPRAQPVDFDVLEEQQDMLPPTWREALVRHLAWDSSLSERTTWQEFSLRELGVVARVGDETAPRLLWLKEMLSARQPADPSELEKVLLDYSEAVRPHRNRCRSEVRRRYRLVLARFNIATQQEDTSAEQTLERTRSMYFDAFGQQRFADLSKAIRFLECDSVFPGRERTRRFGRLVSGLGLAEGLQQLRTTESESALSTQLSNAETIIRSSVEAGLRSELQFVSHAGRALAVALSDPALPRVFRAMHWGTSARALGIALALAHFQHARKDRALSGRERARFERASTLLWLFELRRAALSALEPRSEKPLILTPETTEVDVAAVGYETFVKTVGFETSHAAVELLAFDEFQPGARLQGLQTGAALFATLRDLFDEDWYLNPRSRDYLYALFRPGFGQLDVDVSLADTIWSEYFR